MANHETLSGDALHDAFNYVQGSDPGAVGAGKYWLDTSGDPYLLKRRNGTNTTWIDVGDAGGAGSDTSAIHDDQTGEIAALTSKATPVDADVTIIEDSAAANAKKKLTWANIKATLKTYFDTLYVTLALFDANTILAANSDNTPSALTIGEATVVGRQTGGNIDDIPQVSAGEKTAGTETALRAFSPDDVKDMIDTHGGAGGGLYASYAKFEEQQTSGTAGGGFTQGSYVTRVLNTEVHDDDSIVSLSSNQFTPIAGDYIIEAFAPASAVGNHKAKLRNATQASDVIIGQTSRASASPATTGSAYVSGKFTANGTDAYEIQHRCQVTKTTDGLGQAASFGDIEVYTTVNLWKLN